LGKKSYFVEADVKKRHVSSNMFGKLIIERRRVEVLKDDAEMGTIAPDQV
jgi:hypothetical protein